MVLKRHRFRKPSMKIKEGSMYSVGKSKIPIHSKGLILKKQELIRRLTRIELKFSKGLDIAKLVSD